MDDFDKARFKWRDALNLSKELNTDEEKDLVTKLPWEELCKVSHQILYKAHHTRNSGLKYRSEESMRKSLNLSPTIT